MAARIGSFATPSPPGTWPSAQYTIAEETDMPVDEINGLAGRALDLFDLDVDLVERWKGGDLP